MWYAIHQQKNSNNRHQCNIHKICSLIFWHFHMIFILHPFVSSFLIHFHMWFEYDWENDRTSNFSTQSNLISDIMMNNFFLSTSIIGRFFFKKNLNLWRNFSLNSSGFFLLNYTRKFSLYTAFIKIVKKCLKLFLFFSSWHFLQANWHRSHLSNSQQCSPCTRKKSVD